MSTPFLDEQLQEAWSNVAARATNANSTPDEEEEYVRQLAASLAPAVEELDALFASPGMELTAHLDKMRQLGPTPQKLDFDGNATADNGQEDDDDDQNQNHTHNNFNRRSTYNDDYDYASDGSFDDELENLATSEQLLRQELEFAHDFGAMMNTPNVKAFYVPPAITVNSTATPAAMTFNNTRHSSQLRDSPKREDNVHHGDVDINDSNVGLDLTEHNDDNDEQSEGQHPAYNFKYNIDDPDDDDDDEHGDDEDRRKGELQQQQQEEDDYNKWLDRQSAEAEDPYNQYHAGLDASSQHYKDDNLNCQQHPHVSDETDRYSSDQHGGEGVPFTPPTKSLPPKADSITSPSITRHNYTLSDHSHYLKIQTESRGGWYYMPIVHLDPTVKEYIIPLPEKELDRLYVGLHDEEDESNPRPLAIRTVGYKIRPDVLVGAVMDAIMHALEDFCEVQKRQGGHLVLTTNCQTLEMDFQLLSYKGTQGSRFCERTLLMRVYYANRHIDETQFLETLTEEEEQQLDHFKKANDKLKEAAALVQKMETSKQGSSEKFFGTGFWGKKPIYPNKQAMQEAIALQLLKKHKPCPSVSEGTLTIPALSMYDWMWVQYSFKFISVIWDEFQERDLSYASLQVCSFGQFPALTTLDVHYCSQLRRLSREVMVLSLLRSASELEQYAREAEYACANLIQVLKPCFEAYKMDPPGLPQPLPLTAYPLEYTPHQDICPPWGQKVMEAMNGVTAISSDSSGENSFDRAEKAVQLVLDAFQRQHDEEQSARLGRKNLQVMDRLAKMQAHKQTSILKLKQSYSKSEAAKKAADEFHRYAVMANSDLPESEQVPLFKCSIWVGSSTGSVYISATQLMCVTQFIPLVGGNSVLLLDLVGLEFVVQEASTSLLNPLPAGISVRRGGSEVVLFRPSYAAARLKVFLDIVQVLGGPSPKHYIGHSIHDDEAGTMDHTYGDMSRQEYADPTD